jgi:hypothetical protein
LAEVALGVVRGHVAPDPLACLVVDGLMGYELLADLLVLVPAIGVEHGIGHVDPLGDGLAERGPGHVGDHLRPDLSGSPVDQGQDRRLVGDALASSPGFVPMPEAGLPADPGLVGRDRPDEHPEPVVLHGLPDALGEEPCAPRAETVLALDLAGADTVFRGAHLEDHEHPRPNENLGPVHDRVRQDRELTAARPALPEAALGRLPGAGSPALAIGGSQEVAAILVATVRADRGAVPAKLLKVGVGGPLIGNPLGDPEDVGL